MWMTSHLSLHPAVVIASFGQSNSPRADTLAQLDRHVLRDIGVEPGRAGAPSPSPSLMTTPGESASPQRSAGQIARPTTGR